MLRTILICGALAAFSAPAFAAPGDITLNIAGKTQAEIDAMVLGAARDVCRDALRGSRSAFGTISQCAHRVATETKAEIVSMTKVATRPVAKTGD